VLIFFVLCGASKNSTIQQFIHFYHPVLHKFFVCKISASTDSVHAKKNSHVTNGNTELRQLPTNGK